ncbi:hypothetical protein KUV50_16925 [Membranicola marinus]|uniref:Uncharacterized protein n=1 Tax=Membranihabitans marinus TaxID=1227546 RepID=A0A953HWM0_9BACT|nr:hypothetical protein [Membranihabitans marinus]MBY5959840.1 hypothetical protein [Membranihabitans marinus]
MIETAKFKNPFYMAAGLLLVFLVIFVLHYLYVLMAGETMDLLNIWVYMMAAGMVFSIFSTINLLYAKNTGKYYNKTLMAFAGLVIIGVLLATWISGENIFDLETYRNVFLFVIIAFLVFISVASLIKQVENWSRKKDEDFLNK